MINYNSFGAMKYCLVKGKKKFKEYKNYRDFPGGPVAKTPHSQCRGPGFNPWSGN